MHGRASASGLGNQRVHDVFDIGFELVVVEPRVVQLQAELQEADIGGVRQAGTVLRRGARQAGLAETGGELVEAPLRHALDDRADGGMVQRLEQLAIDNV